MVYDNLSRNNYNLFTDFSGLTKVQFIKGDILDGRSLAKALQNIDVVYHLAAIVTTPFADSQVHQFEQVNHWGSAELARLLEKSTVKQLIYLSSTAVYGHSTREVSVSSETNASSFYGISKLQGEQQLMRLNQKGIDVRVVRSGNVFGFGQSMRFDSVINKFLFEAHHFGRLKIFGDGNQQRSFVALSRLIVELLAPLGTASQDKIRNSVDFVLSINDIVDVLKQLYPQLEMIFVNQNTIMRSLHVTPTTGVEKSQFELDINAMRSQFSIP